MIAWLTHHLPKVDGEQSGIPGKYRGGAEMTDARYLEASPEPVTVFSPNEWKKAAEFDKLIITGTDLLSDTALIELAAKKPVVMVHHKQTQSVARKTLLDSAEILICHTPKHLELELAWTSPKSSTWILSSHDPQDFSAKPKENFALWAARMHSQKGLDNAIKWAETNDMSLTMYWDKPRDVVLETMSRAKHFVFLPNGFDAEPRTVIEAVLSGCKVHINENVGIGSIQDWDNPEVMTRLVSTAANKFWETVL